MAKGRFLLAAEIRAMKISSGVPAGSKPAGFFIGSGSAVFPERNACRAHIYFCGDLPGNLQLGSSQPGNLQLGSSQPGSSKPGSSESGVRYPGIHSPAVRNPTVCSRRSPCQNAARIRSLRNIAAQDGHPGGKIRVGRRTFAGKNAFFRTNRGKFRFTKG